MWSKIDRMTAMAMVTDVNSEGCGWSVCGRGVPTCTHDGRGHTLSYITINNGYFLYTLGIAGILFWYISYVRKKGYTVGTLGYPRGTHLVLH